MWHGYMLIEDLGMTNNQRSTLNDYLIMLGDNDSSQPAHRNHRRVRLDNKAIIFEALFNDDNLTIANVKSKLAEIFEVDVSTIAHSVNDGYVTFSRNGEKLLMKLFGGKPSTWNESREACAIYLKANLALWEDPEDI